MALPTAYLEHFVVPEGKGTRLLAVADVDCIEADGNYVRLYAGPNVRRIRETIGAIEQRLDPRLFVRIHRCTIVNVTRVVAVEPLDAGDHLVTLQSGVRLRLSRARRKVAVPPLRAQAGR